MHFFAKICLLPRGAVNVFKLSGAFGRLIDDNVLLAVNHYHLEDNSCRKHFRFFCFGLPKCTLYKILYSNRAFLWVRIMNTNVRIMNISTSFDKFSPVYRLSSHFMVFYKKTKCEVKKCLVISYSPFITCSAYPCCGLPQIAVWSQSTAAERRSCWKHAVLHSAV